MINVEKIRLCVDENFGWATSIRRHLHMHPELSFREFETSKFIAKTLEEIGIPYTLLDLPYSSAQSRLLQAAGALNGSSVNSGILAVIEGALGGPAIGLRADIDALPILEETNLSFASVNSGVMHACGHDMHTSALLLAAKALWESRLDLAGTVYLLFQPGEECLPGGAKLVLDSGILDDKKIEAFVALHVSPEIDAGKVGIRPGMYMASGDEIHIEIKGKGGHAALPHTLNDTVLAASSVVVALQQLVARLGDSRTPSVLSIGKFIANGATNIIPSSVKLEGTFRTMNEEWRAAAHKHITDMVEATAKAHQTTAVVDIRKGYPCLINDPAKTLAVRNELIENLGKDSVVDLDIRMTTEDFGFISNRYPSVFFRLGVGGESKSSGVLHNSKFIAREDALKTGALSLISAINALLKQSF